MSLNGDSWSTFSLSAPALIMMNSASLASDVEFIAKLKSQLTNWLAARQFPSLEIATYVDEITENLDGLETELARLDMAQFNVSLDQTLLVLSKVDSTMIQVTLDSLASLNCIISATLEDSPDKMLYVQRKSSAIVIICSRYLHHFWVSSTTETFYLESSSSLLSPLIQILSEMYHLELLPSLSYDAFFKLINSLLPFLVVYNTKNGHNAAIPYACISQLYNKLINEPFNRMLYSDWTGPESVNPSTVLCTVLDLLCIVTDPTSNTSKFFDQLSIRNLNFRREAFKLLQRRLYFLVKSISSKPAVVEQLKLNDILLSIYELFEQYDDPDQFSSSLPRWKEAFITVKWLLDQIVAQQGTLLWDHLAAIDEDILVDNRNAQSVPLFAYLESRGLSKHFGSEFVAGSHFIGSKAARTESEIASSELECSSSSSDSSVAETMSVAKSSSESANSFEVVDSPDGNLDLAPGPMMTLQTGDLGQHTPGQSVFAQLKLLWSLKK